MSPNSSDDIEQLANSARESISDFCMHTCQAYCCHRGILPIKADEIDTVIGDKKNLLIQQGNLALMEDGRFALDFNNSLGGCPQLDGTKCRIHSHPKRPATCHKFPIFIEENKKIRLSPRCPAVVQGKFFVFEKYVIALGYKIKS